MSFTTAYDDNHVSFEIAEIAWEEDASKEVGGQDAPLVNQELLDRLEGTARGTMLANIYDEKLEEFDDSRNSINFTYEAPAISVDTAGRFIKHGIVGGSTVRQKIGEDPIQVNIDGICKESTALRLDTLRDAKYGTIYSNRLPNGSLRVHFASTSTSPLDDGGAVAISDESGEFLYNYTMSAVEVVV